MKENPTHAALGFVVWIASLLAAPAVLAQGDQIYFPAVDNVTQVLVSKIDAETVRVDMSAWYLTEHAISISLVNAFRRGVQVRLIGDRGSIFEIDPKTKGEFYWLASQGVPIRLRYNPTWYPEIDHMKATIFRGQRLVSFGSANYTPNQLAPASSTDYSDETVMFTTDPVLVGAFLTRFDVIWNDTTVEPDSRISGPPYLKNWNDACALESACADYSTLYPNRAPMSVDTARLEGNNATPADLIWGQGPAFNSRITQEIGNESTSIRIVVYRLTVDDITQALLARFQAGVPTRIIIDPAEYANRTWPEFWLTRANIDKLWAAGVPIKQRQHNGLTHMKMLVTSRYATNASSNFAAAWQRDNDYFVSASAKPAIYQAMANRFETMWNDTAGFASFVPQPPDAPVLSAPASGTGNLAQKPTLTWATAAFATSYDVYLGRSPDTLVLVGNVPAQLVNDPPATYSWTSPAALAAGSVYYWQIVARTNATVRNPAIVARSSTWSFVTGGLQGSGGVADDYNIDGFSDIIWRNTATGEDQVWFMRSTTLLATAALPTQAGADWRIVGSSDFNGDAHPDLVWRNIATGENKIWTMVGSSRLGEVPFASVTDLTWRMVGVGDFSGTGKPGLLWRNTTSGVNVIWWMANGQYSSYTHIPSVTDQNWRVAGVGDFNGDGKADIVWQNRATGLNVVWYMNVTTLLGYSRLPGVGDQNWRIVAVGDYNGDLWPDLFWRNKVTGENVIWFMKGVTFIGYARTRTVPDQNWQVGPGQ